MCLRTPRGGWSGQPRSCWREVGSLLCRGHLKEGTNFGGTGELLGQAEAQVRLCTCSARFCGSLFRTWVLADSLSLVTAVHTTKLRKALKSVLRHPAFLTVPVLIVSPCLLRGYGKHQSCSSAFFVPFLH
uniref:Uncharacterized protein n=1 Tax=Accipiter nisus TaxID=211598 RepID=A0A8B9N3R1_9AVES